MEIPIFNFLDLWRLFLDILYFGLYVYHVTLPRNLVYFCGEKKGMLGFKGMYGKWKDLTSLGDSYCSVAQSCPTLTPWTAAHQACLSFTISQSLLKLVSFESVILSNHLILCHPLLFLPSVFPSIRDFCSDLALGGQTIGVSASATVLPLNIQDWFSLGLTGLISMLSKGLLRVFSSAIVRKHQFFGA